MAYDQWDNALNRYQSGYAGQQQWAQYHPRCPCAMCQNLRAVAQDYAKSLEVENNNRAREMTAADLGLPLPQWTREFVCGLYGDEWFERTYVEWLHPTPPYSFWLGADA